MGTLWRIVIHTGEAGRARSAADAAFARIDALNKVMSDYDSDSQVRRLGTQWTPAGDDLLRVLVASREFGVQSGGAFDITAGPLTKLWRRALRRQRRPGADALADAMAVTGLENLMIDEPGKRVRFAVPGMRVDLGGIGKGFALDEAMKVLRENHGIHRALIDAGGDVIAGDPPPGREGWMIEVRGNGSFRLRVRNLAVATSGDLHQFALIDGKRVSHLVDPRTGDALADGAAATVVARSATTADAMASALCVMNDNAGRILAGKLLAAGEITAARVSRGAGKVRWEVEMGKYESGKLK